MKLKCLLTPLIGVLVTPLNAASFDCNKATTQTEKTICTNPELSALDELASTISHYVGLRIDLQTIPTQQEYVSEDPMTERISNHYSEGIEKMMGLLSPANLPNLKKSINKLENWRAGLFSEGRVFILAAKNDELRLQNGIVVFSQIFDDLNDKPVFHNLDSHISRVSVKYELVDGILIRELNDSRFYSNTKYRYQEDCWREIGSEWEEFFDGGPVDAVRKTSTNFLTGTKIKTLYSGNVIVEKFPQSVNCLTQ